MTVRLRTWWAFALLVAAVLAARPGGQRPELAGSLAVVASGAALDAWATRVQTMLRDGLLDITRVQADTMIAGRTHERLGQTYLGLPVFDGEIVRQLDGRRIVSMFGRFFDGVALPSISPTLSPADAVAIAEEAAGADTVADDPDLGVLVSGGRSVLVYRATVRGPWDVCLSFINARTGAVERSASQIRHQDAMSVGRGRGVLGDEKKISIEPIGGSYYAVDRLRPAEAYTFAFSGDALRFGGFLQTGVLFDSDIARSSSTTWSDVSVVDAHAYQGWVYDYYYKRFGRRGLDDANFELLSIVHPLARALAPAFPPSIVNTWINNAGYLHPGLMIYGDGDGVTFDYLAGGFDVIAHELTHGVTAFSSDLLYEDEPGALNEAFSDIMATGAEFFQFHSGQGPQRGPNFLIGEDVYLLPPGYVRSLQDPAEVGDPDHYSLRRFIGSGIDNGGVHFNSTIVSHAFYLAVAGGTNRVSGVTVQGVGVGNIDRMEKIFYRAFTFFLGPLSQFSDARAATLEAATELYGTTSSERTQLERAWDAVGVR